MKRFNLLELMALVVFSDLSIGTPPMLNGEGSSSSSAPEPSPSRTYELEFFIHGQLTGTMAHLNSFIVLRMYNDPATVEYSLTTSNGDDVFSNSARNTDIVFKLHKKMKIRAKDNNDVSYSLEFKRDLNAHIISYYIISAYAEQYEKCEGSNSYKLKKLYQRRTSGALLDLGPHWCIFKTHTTNMTTFMIKYMASRDLGDFRDVKCIFPSTDYSLTRLPTANNNKLELSVSFGGQFLDPKFVLKTSTPDMIEEFFSST